MKRAIRWYDYITINIYYFALTTRNQVLTPLILPLLIQQFVGEGSKGTYLGIIRLWALMVAVLIQALMGALSDRSTLRMGRRRPFIIIGTFGEILVILLIGAAAGMSGMLGYWVLFTLYIASMISSNTAFGAVNGLIPDLVPEKKHGIFSGIKTLLELPFPLIFVSFVIGKMVEGGNIWGALVALIIVLIAAMLIAMFVPEEQLKEKPGKFDWAPYIPLFWMTAAFTAIILGAGALVKNLTKLTESPLIIGVIGLLGMILAVGLGVYFSIQISLKGEQKNSPSFTWWVINRLAFLVAANNLAGFMVFFLQERFIDLQGEKAAGPAARIVMFVGILILLSALPSGWLSDRFGRKPLIITSGLLAAIGTLVVVTAPNLTLITVGACLIGAGVGFFYTSNWALGTDIVPKDQAGRYLGISNLAGAGAGAVGAYIGGPIGDSSGYVLLLSIYGVMAFISIFALAGVSRKYR